MSCLVELSLVGSTLSEVLSVGVILMLVILIIAVLHAVVRAAQSREWRSSLGIADSGLDTVVTLSLLT